MSPRTTERPSATLDGVEVEVLHLWMEADAPEVVRSNLPEADPAWRYTDRAGHKHAPETHTSMGAERVRDWPTLAVVVDETYWCADCNDEHEHTHRECRICGEQIEPGSRTARDLVIPGLMYVKANLRGGTYSREERTLVVGEETFRGYTPTMETSLHYGVEMTFEGRPA